MKKKGPDLQPYEFKGYSDTSYIPQHITDKLYEAYKELEDYYNCLADYYCPDITPPEWKEAGFKNEYRWKAAIAKRYGNIEEMEKNLRKAIIFEKELEKIPTEKDIDSFEPIGFDDDDFNLLDFDKDDDLEDNNISETPLTEITDEDDEYDEVEEIAIDDDEEPFVENDFAEDETGLTDEETELTIEDIELTDEEIELLSDLEKDNPSE